jgi:hypothetical protein
VGKWWTSTVGVVCVCFARVLWSEVVTRVEGRMLCECDVNDAEKSVPDDRSPPLSAAQVSRWWLFPSYLGTASLSRPFSDTARAKRKTSFRSFRHAINKVGPGISSVDADSTQNTWRCPHLVASSELLYFGVHSHSSFAASLLF